MNLIRWLLDEKKCSLFDRITGKPLTTATGLTPLAVAAMRGHLEVMHYLVHEKKCSVNEISEISLLRRALHAALRVNHLSMTIHFHLDFISCNLGTWTSTATAVRQEYKTGWRRFHRQPIAKCPQKS